ncbi:hypothetical protein BDV26DRAFT_284165 [Aspergillus bertholletiae]|uniref:PB1 domain-containing protein n=1 Tax=Aspergillus bertholletiae TaxID=1226010 RepID=A0A5N7AXK7_9EURO|nr:hypothetical protein BDV26DRAFT_284165 [Aspergillus bertholletiae]
MSIKQEIETWVQALEHYDRQEYDDALRVFGLIADTSKIFFNCGVIYATLGEHEKAVECYQRAVGLDQYLAIAYFQEGVSNFLLGDFEEALANFNDTLLYLRGNTSIDYEQLGLKFRLYSCEVLFNRGLCYIYLQQLGPGIQDLEYAAKEKVTPDHGVINDAIRERAEGYTVFSIPVGVLYRPNEAKVKNLKTKDYLGKARLIAASDRSGVPPQAGDITRVPSVLDQRAPPESLFAASKLVQRNITRSRQHSEPPMSRNLFPPTPPPDADKSSVGSPPSSSGMSGRPGSIRAVRPPRLDLDRPGAHPPGCRADTTPEKPRIGTTRTASEPRGPPMLQHRASQGEFTAPRETGHRRGGSDVGFPPPPKMYGEDVYKGYSRPTVVVNGGRRGMPRQRERYIEEEEYASEAEEGGTDGDFEIVDSRRRTRSPNRGSRRANSRRPEVRRFRVKVHAVEDTRYIIIGPTVDFSEFEMKIRDKFGFRCVLKIRMQDEGDMITMVDQEDLDLLFSSAREAAIRERSELGKMEIWVEERSMI